MKLQRYTCVLKKAGILTVADGCSSIRHVQHAQMAAHKELENSPVERILSFYLDGAHNLLGFEQVSQGGISGSSITPRDILRGAIAANASAIILAHNHPSGNPDPSRDDIDMTRMIVRACDLIGITLLDHIVVTTSGRWTSMAEMGII